MLMILGIVYMSRRQKLRALTVSQFPGVPADVFAKWKALELKSINIFLWAAWGLFLIYILLGSALALVFPEGWMLVLAGCYWVLLIVLLTLSAIPGTKAAKLKKQHGIRWPK